MAMKVEIKDVTPEMAADWLVNIPLFQRKARSSFVDRYARDMANNKWGLTHQGIAFDNKGRLIDGQHRLLAIIKANVTIRMVVVQDAPATSFDHVDIGFGRTTSDVMRANGDSWITNDHLAVARFMEGGDNPTFLVTNRSPFEQREMVEAHEEAIEFVFKNMERKVRGITIAPVLAAVGVAYYYENDRVKLAEFMRLLVSGISHDHVRDETVIRFREWLRDSKGSASSSSRIVAFMRTQRAIKAFMLNERLTKLYTPSMPVYQIKRKVFLN